MIRVVRYVDGPTTGHCHRQGRLKSSRRAHGVNASRISGESCEGAHRSVGSNLPNRVIATVRDINVSSSIDRNTSGVSEACCRARPIVTALGSRDSGQRADHSRRVNLANGVSAVVGDVDRTRRIDCHAARRGKPRRGSEAIRVPDASGHAGKRADEAGRRDFSDGAVEEVRDVKVARGVAGHAKRSTEPSGRSSSIDRARPADFPRNQRQCARHVHGSRPESVAVRRADGSDVIRPPGARGGVDAVCRDASARGFIHRPRDGGVARTLRDRKRLRPAGSDVGRVGRHREELPHVAVAAAGNGQREQKKHSDVRCSGRGEPRPGGTLEEEVRHLRWR